MVVLNKLILHNLQYGIGSSQVFTGVSLERKYNLLLLVVLLRSSDIFSSLLNGVFGINGLKQLFSKYIFP